MTTSSVPPSTFFTSGGISDSTTAPTSQNQLVTRPPHHRRWSLHRSFSSAPVERAMLGSTSRFGAPWPVRGMSRLEPQQSSAKTMISAPNIGRMVALLGGEAADDGAEQDRHEGRAFDQRVAGGQLFPLQMIGQDAVLDRAEQRRDHAEQEQRDEHDRHGVQPEADDAERRRPRSRRASRGAPRSPCRSGRPSGRRARRGRRTAR